MLKAHLSTTTSIVSIVSIVIVTGALALSACPGGPPADTPDGGPDVQTCSEPADVSCRDEVFQALLMSLTEVCGINKPCTVENTPEGDGFVSELDASSNGPFAIGPWLHVRFTDNGLEPVDVTDDESLNSMDWDLGLHRFTIRLNSGYGGPSCVTAARTAANTDFDSLDAVPADLDFNAELFMSDPEGCELRPDSSGQGSAGVVLQNWWTYPGCVATTGNVYVLGLKDGRHVKLVVTQFYENGQDACNNGGGSGSASGGGHIKIRWAFLDS